MASTSPSPTPTPAPAPDSGRCADHEIDLARYIDLLAEMPVAGTEEAAIDRVRILEGLKAACAAAQARETEQFRSLRCQAESDAGMPARERGRGVAAEIALARGESPNSGSRDVGLARALVGEMPHTMTALTRGAISEWKAIIMCKETAWLPVEARQQVDAALAERLETWGVKRLGGEARRLAQQLDPASAVAQSERHERERRVSVRPAPGGMAYLTALLPMRQAVGCLGALKKTAATTVGTGSAAERTQDQVVADLLVERVTGQAEADAVPVEVHLIITDQALLGTSAATAQTGWTDQQGQQTGWTDRRNQANQTGASADPAETPAWCVGHGPIPAESARRWLSESTADVFLRRLYTAPETGQLVQMDSQRREFSGLLRRMVILREDTCRTPWCDAQIKHIDHVVPYREGGKTTLSNGSGLCERCNYTKENPGWQHEATEGGLVVKTPTGHRYRQPTDPLTPLAPPRPAMPGMTVVPETPVIRAVAARGAASSLVVSRT
ncbi:DUF222 domain-containing protein [Citricoccus sp. GCM10030269]|uniref:HNH endonuclease n=1 Tax=Citricoccus sp. GCM10030269 TaxID=3273388 RepID=UPI00361E75EE